MNPNTPLLELNAIHKTFGEPSSLRRWFMTGGAVRRQPHKALDGVSIEVGHGEIVGLIGESGSGKSTLGRIACGLTSPDAGERRWQGRSLTHAATQPLNLQMIYQDAAGALNPRRRVSELIMEAPIVHGLISSRQKQTALTQLLDSVGLAPEIAGRYPHQLSGGQRARVGIARALALQPQLLVCDEAVAALDVSVQAQVLNLFQDLRQNLGLSYLFISHDLAVVRYLCDRVYVMYQGKIVESGATDSLFAAPEHPYTRELLRAMPTLALAHR